MNMLTFKENVLIGLEIVLVLFPIVCSILKQTNYTTQFVLAIVGMLPLAKIVGDCVENLCEHYCSRSVAGFLAATLGNFPELIFGVVAVYNGQMHLMSAAMFGSPISNILLVFGTSIIAGTFFKNTNARFFKDKTVHCVGANITMMSALSYTFVVIVTQLNSNGVTLNEKIGLSEIIALCNFALYAFFTFRKFYGQNNVCFDHLQPLQHIQSLQPLQPDIEKQTLLRSSPNIKKNYSTVITSDDNDVVDNLNNSTPPSLLYIITTMCVVTVCITLLSDIISDKIDIVLMDTPVSKTFVGIIVLPFICNAAEHVSAIYQMLSNDDDAADGAMEVASGSAYQILGFVVPLINFLSFGAKDIFTFDIDPLILITLNITTLILAIIVSNNRLDLFEGLGMVMIWFMIGGTFYVYDAVIA